MIDINNMVKKVVKIKIKDGDRISAYLVEIVDNNFLKLRFKSGIEAYLAISDILFISPAKVQPAEVV